MVSRTKLKNEIYKLTQPLTAKRYSDDHWQGVEDIRRVIVEAMNNLDTDEYDFYITVDNRFGTGYQTSNDGLYIWKAYMIKIFKTSNMKEQLVGYLNCHAAGTVEDPFKYYDMSLIISLA